jgi:preprotein translocase subunit YajC
MYFVMAAEQKTSALGSILPLLILAPIAYVLIVPQRKQKKKAAEMLASLGVGDEVITSGGIYGTITFLEDNVAHLAVDTDVVIRVSKSSITRQSTTPAADDSTDSDDDGEDEATSKSKPTKS